MKINKYASSKQKVVRKKCLVNKQYILKMIHDKRFGPNHEKYLRLKAFTGH